MLYMVFISDPLIVPHPAPPHNFFLSQFHKVHIQFLTILHSFSPSSTHFLIVHTVLHNYQQSTQCHKQFHTDIFTQILHNFPHTFTQIPSKFLTLFHTNP